MSGAPGIESVRDVTTHLPDLVRRFALLIAAAMALALPSAAAAGPPGLQWSAPKQIDGAAPFTSGQSIEGVSCGRIARR